MHHQIYINSDTTSEVEKYLTMPVPPGIILQGIPGLGKKIIAKYIASKLLNCSVSSLSENPDYYQTQSSNSLKVDDIEKLLEASQRSSIGNKKVFIIFNAHTISGPSQNRLLKLLEDRAESNILIIISEKDCLLDTIKSRCFTIYFHPLCGEKMAGYLRNLKIEDDYIDFIGFLTENAPYSIMEFQNEIVDYIDCYKRIRQIALREDLFQLFHVLKEKDENDFFKKHDQHPAWNIRTLLYPFYKLIMESLNGDFSSKYGFPYKLYNKRQSIKIMEYGLNHLSIVHNAYTKNDYFNLIRFIVQIK